MKDYKKELDNYEYNKKYRVENEHRFDFLKEKEDAKKFEDGEHKLRTYEVKDGVMRPAKELIIPTKGDVKQSSPEITGQFVALPAE